MKQLSDFGRLINSFSTNVQLTDKPGSWFLHFCIVIQNGADRWVITKNFNFFPEAWQAPSSKIGSLKISEEILLGRVGCIMVGWGMGKGCRVMQYKK